MLRRERWGGDIWGPRKERRTFGDKHWNEPLKWNRKARSEGSRRKVFCASMADVFDEDAPSQERKRLWQLIDDTPSLDWLLLTKRPEQIRGMIPERWWMGRPENVWLGVSVENRDQYQRIEKLQETSAVVRFLSVEPLLAAVADLPLDGIHWVIVGGESGRGARPMAPEWVRHVRDRTVARGIPFFFKQWGGVNKKAAGRKLDGREWSEMPACSDNPSYDE